MKEAKLMQKCTIPLELGAWRGPYHAHCPSQRRHGHSIGKVCRTELTSCGELWDKPRQPPLPLSANRGRGRGSVPVPGQIGDGDGGASPSPAKSGTDASSPSPDKSGTGTGTGTGVSVPWAGQVRFQVITRPKSRTMRVTRQLMLPPSTVT
jgi:hypothetical protein